MSTCGSDQQTRFRVVHPPDESLQPATVAVIIPCRNEEKYIGRCLDSLLENDYDRRLLEIVVVDGMSDDQTRSIVQGYASKYPFIRLLDNPQRNKPAALNLGIQQTCSDVVMRIDAHATYASEYISRLVHGLFQHQADNIGGIRETGAGGSTWSRAVAIAISHPFAAGDAVYRTGACDSQPQEVDTVFCGCYRREVFERIGLFHPELIRTQDREFNLRLLAHGGRIVLDPGVRCTYFPRTGLRDYAKWVFQGARWVYYADRFVDTRMRSLRNLVPAAFVAWHAVVLMAWLRAPSVLVGALLPLLAYWVIAFGFALRASIKQGSPLMLPYLITLFAVTHYGYGVGSFVGLIQARLRGKQLVEHAYPRRERRQVA